MPKEKPNFILELKLNTELFQEDILNKRFEIGRKIYNQTLSYANKQLNLMKESKIYRKVFNNYINETDKDKKKAYSMN